MENYNRPNSHFPDHGSGHPNQNQNPNQTPSQPQSWATRMTGPYPSIQQNQQGLQPYTQGEQVNQPFDQGTLSELPPLMRQMSLASRLPQFDDKEQRIAQLLQRKAELELILQQEEEFKLRQQTLLNQTQGQRSVVSQPPPPSSTSYSLPPPGTAWDVIRGISIAINMTEADPSHPIVEPDVETKRYLANWDGTWSAWRQLEPRLHQAVGRYQAHINRLQPQPQRLQQSQQPQRSQQQPQLQGFEQYRYAPIGLAPLQSPIVDPRHALLASQSPYQQQGSIPFQPSRQPTVQDAQDSEFRPTQPAVTAPSTAPLSTATDPPPEATPRTAQEVLASDSDEEDFDPLGGEKERLRQRGG